MTKTEILGFLREHREELESRFGLKTIGLFGSYARGEEREDSDIDLAVEIESANTFRSFFGLKHYLEDHLRHSIDLGVESALKPSIKEQITKEIIYA